MPPDSESLEKKVPDLDPLAEEVIGHDALRLRVWDYGGGGPPLLLCHCTGVCGRIWDPVVARLGGAFRVLAVDTRGQGDSEAPGAREEHAWWRSGADLVAVLEHFDLPAGTWVCGHSAGGAHVVYAELAEPGSFGKMMLIDPIIAPYEQFGKENPLAEKVRYRVNTFSSRAQARQRYSAKPPMQHWHEEALEAYLTHALSEAADGSVALKCAGHREAWYYELGGASEVFERIHEVRCPVLLVTGSESYLQALVEMQASRFAAATRETVEGAGHFIPQEHPDAVARLLKEWFA